MAINSIKTTFLTPERRSFGNLFKTLDLVTSVV